MIGNEKLNTRVLYTFLHDPAPAGVLRSQRGRELAMAAGEILGNYREQKDMSGVGVA